MHQVSQWKWAEKTHNEGVEGGCQLGQEDNSVVTGLIACCMQLLLKTLGFSHLIYRATQVKSSKSQRPSVIPGYEVGRT